MDVDTRIIYLLQYSPFFLSNCVEYETDPAVVDTYKLHMNNVNRELSPKIKAIIVNLVDKMSNKTILVTGRGNL
jgi:hypothetical protein